MLAYSVMLTLTSCLAAHRNSGSDSENITARAQETAGGGGLATVDVAADHNREMVLLRHGAWLDARNRVKVVP